MTVDAKAMPDRVAACIDAHGLEQPDAPVLLMVSGGSDSTALAYLAADLHRRGRLGPLAMLHVNHRLRGADSDADAAFVARLAEVLDIPLFNCEIDVGALTREEGGNLEAVARRERYAAADEALKSLCMHEARPLAQGRIFTAHTADDRVETFYMRSIVGTGPGGFRSMRYLNGRVARPCLDVGRNDLCAYVRFLASAGERVVRDEEGALWREDATNAHTDRFRAYVRHEVVPRAKERNPQLAQTLVRTMNLIADEDDYLDGQVDRLFDGVVSWIVADEANGPDFGAGFVLSPEMGKVHPALGRRVVVRALGLMLPEGSRVEAASVESVLAGYADGRMNSGYVSNIQGNLAVSANKRGVRVEPMAAFRTRRNRRG